MPLSFFILLIVVPAAVAAYSFFRRLRYSEYPCPWCVQPFYSRRGQSVTRRGPICALHKAERDLLGAQTNRRNQASIESYSEKLALAKQLAPRPIDALARSLNDFQPQMPFDDAIQKVLDAREWATADMARRVNEWTEKKSSEEGFWL